MLTLRVLRELLSKAEDRLGPNAPVLISGDGYNCVDARVAAHRDYPGALVLTVHTYTSSAAKPAPPRAA